MGTLTPSEEVLALALAKQELEQLREANSSLLVQLDRHEEQTKVISKESEFYRKKASNLQQDLQHAQQQNSRMEEQVYSRDQELEGLRHELQSLGRQLRSVQKQMEEDSQHFEEERLSWSEKDAKLQDQLEAVQKQLHKALDSQHIYVAPRSHVQAHKPKRASVDSIATSINIEDIKEQERQMKIAQKNIREQDKLILELRDQIDKQKDATNNVIDQYKTQSLKNAYLESEMDQLKNANSLLQEDNESYQRLLQEKTVNGEFSLGDNYTEEQPPMPTTPGFRQDLAAELTRAVMTPSSPTASSFPVNISPREQELEEKVTKLNGEVKSIKDENKALTLYINKILSRIMESSQMENILASDFDKKKMARDMSQTSKSDASSSSSSLSHSSSSNRRSSVLVTPAMLSPRQKPSMDRNPSSHSPLGPNVPNLSPPLSPGADARSARKWRRHQSMTIPKGRVPNVTTEIVECENGKPPATVAGGGLRRAWKRMSVLAWKYPTDTGIVSPTIEETGGIPEE